MKLVAFLRKTAGSKTLSSSILRTRDSNSRTRGAAHNTSGMPPSPRRKDGSEVEGFRDCRIVPRNGQVDAAEHAALRKIDVTPYVMPSLDEMAERRDRVSNATILRTLRHNLEQWAAGARGMIGKSDNNENDLYWVGRAHGFEKALELVASLERSLLK